MSSLPAKNRLRGELIYPGTAVAPRSRRPGLNQAVGPGAHSTTRGGGRPGSPLPTYWGGNRGFCDDPRSRVSRGLSFHGLFFGSIPSRGYPRGPRTARGPLGRPERGGYFSFREDPKPRTGGSQWSSNQ